MGRRRRAVKSSVERLPPELREEIARLRLGQGRTLDEILAHLKALGESGVSRSALGRHVKQLEDEVRERTAIEMAKMAPAMQFANAMSSAMVEAFGELAAPDKLDATSQILQSILFRMALAGMRDDPEGAALQPKDIFVMARGLQTLEQAKRTAEERAAKAAERAARAAREEAAASAATSARAAGLSAATVEQIRLAVLGEGS
ncbi:phage protein Gp27 family protein [Thermaurantiacus tibetensis]|uniref:phage protein Gp27 family protein n=1 Tax=Thermaurantiacus tibetensis TaxID=2759035 RepID=UPI0018907543|nr:phage protein Gp27 family protein [Thermaurantiacus tibetensis]